MSTHNFGFVIMYFKEIKESLCLLSTFVPLLKLLFYRFYRVAID